MTRNSAPDKLLSVHYNRDLLNWRRLQLGLSVRQIALILAKREDTVGEVFKGISTYKQVRPVTNVLGLNWALVHDLTLPKSKYPDAVLNGHFKKADSIAPKEEVRNSG